MSLQCCISSFCCHILYWPKAAKFMRFNRPTFLLLSKRNTDLCTSTKLLTVFVSRLYFGRPESVLKRCDSNSVRKNRDFSDLPLISSSTVITTHSGLWTVTMLWLKAESFVVFVFCCCGGGSLDLLVFLSNRWLVAAISYSCISSALNCSPVSPGLAACIVAAFICLVFVSLSDGTAPCGMNNVLP